MTTTPTPTTDDEDVLYDHGTTFSPVNSCLYHNHGHGYACLPATITTASPMSPTTPHIRSWMRRIYYDDDHMPTAHDFTSHAATHTTTTTTLNHTRARASIWGAKPPHRRFSIFITPTQTHTQRSIDIEHTTGDRVRVRDSDSDTARGEREIGYRHTPPLPSPHP